jgi:hypothetical protein
VQSFVQMKCFFYNQRWLPCFIAAAMLFCFTRDIASAEGKSVRKVTVQFSNSELVQLQKLPLMVMPSYKLSGSMGKADVEISAEKAASVEVVVVGQQIKVRATTMAGDVFEDVVIPMDGASIDLYSPQPGGRLIVSVPWSAISRIDFGAYEQLPDSGDKERGSILGRFTWSDGASLDMTVWNRNSYNDLGYSDLALAISNASVSIPWKTIKSAAIDESGATVSFTDGGTLKGKMDTAVKVYYDEMEATALGWATVTCLNKEAVALPENISSCCAGAGGCSGGGPFLDSFGNWLFTDKTGKSTEGFIDGPYGGKDAQGGWPGSAYICVCRNNRMSIELMPKTVFSRASFVWGKDSVQVSAQLENGTSLESVLNGDEFTNLSTKGYVLWSSLGGYQVRSVTRARQLAHMELLGSTVPEGWKMLVSDIKHEEHAWQVTLANGKAITARSVSGYQRQPVPQPPSKGFYWAIRPPTQDGFAGGDYVVVPHSTGFYLLPLYAVSSIDPKARNIQLRGDTSGKSMPYVRFHPGLRWVSTGNSGGTYVDDTADKALPVSTPEVIRFITDEGDFAVPASQVTSILQTETVAQTAQAKTNVASKGVPYALVERKNASKFRLKEPILRIDLGTFGASVSAESVIACQQVLMDQFASKCVVGMSGAYRSLACDAGEGLWRKISLSDVVRIVGKGAGFSAMLAGGEEARLGKISGKVEGESSAGKMSVDFSEVNSIAFTCEEAQ